MGPGYNPGHGLDLKASVVKRNAGRKVTRKSVEGGRSRPRRFRD